MLLLPGSGRGATREGTSLGGTELKVLKDCQLRQVQGYKDSSPGSEQFPRYIVIARV